MEIICKEEYFKNWTTEQLTSTTQEERAEIFEFFLNKKECFERDNYKCQNLYCTQEYNSMLIEDRIIYTECHHIIPRRDFKINPSLPKRLGYKCHDLINLTTLCKVCHKSYERAKIAIKINGQEYKLDKPSTHDFKKVIKEAKELRRRLKQAGNVGWAKLTEEERIILICLLMKWISGDVVHEMSD